MPRSKGIKQPIRSLEKVQECKDWLLVNKTYRDYLLFSLGVNVGLRIGDLVKLQVKDVDGKDRLTIIQEKTDKEVIVPLNPTIRAEISDYCKDKDPNDYLFKSRKGQSHISTVMAHYILTEMSKALKIDNFGTHTLRKTFAYHYYKQTHDVYFLMRILGHTKQEQTLKYIGIELDEIIESLQSFKV